MGRLRTGSWRLRVVRDGILWSGETVDICWQHLLLLLQAQLLKLLLMLETLYSLSLELQQLLRLLQLLQLLRRQHV